MGRESSCVPRPDQIALPPPLAPRRHDFEFCIYHCLTMWIVLPCMCVLTNTTSFGVLILVLNRHGIMLHVFSVTCFYAWHISLIDLFVLIHAVGHLSFRGLVFPYINMLWLSQWHLANSSGKYIWGRTLTYLPWQVLQTLGGDGSPTLTQATCSQVS